MEDGPDAILYSAADGVATITLNRPNRLNAWTYAMGERYIQLLEQAGSDASVRVIVVTGAGRGFCAGAEMDEMRPDRLETDVTNAANRYSPVRSLSLPKPIIAAINGGCAGIGLVMALMCDLRFAAEGAKITASFSRRGLIAEHASAWLLARLVGPARALDFLLSSRVVTGREAYELGLANKVTKAETLLEETMAYARDLVANCSPRSMAVIKRQVYADLETDLSSALKNAFRLEERSYTWPDFPEGVASFVERRPPRFEALADGPDYA
ncbi:MAG: enoyl-CoA hydratase [Betaproteobacteria bacterium]|nr:MAG: enoyl-CoA hydratase [Betaproteobacteria bacterium]